MAASDAPEAPNLLHRAAAAGNTNVVEQLLAGGVTVDWRVDQGWVPLHIAVHQGHAPVVQALLRAGADREVRTHSNWTPLHVAAEQGDEGMVALLLAAGCQTGATTDQGSTPLHLAAHEGHLAVVTQLLAAGSDPAVHDGLGRLPLHRAAIGGYVDLLRALAQRGPGINTLDLDGGSCLHYLADNLARFHPTGPAAGRLLRAFLAAGADAALALCAFPTPLNVLLMSRDAVGSVSDNSQSPANTPELIRILAAAGCRVDTEGPPLEDGSDPRRSTVLLWFSEYIPIDHAGAIGWRPRQLSEASLAVSAALLQCAAAEWPAGRPSFLFSALALSSLELVQLVLQTYPATARHWRCETSGRTPVEAALHDLVEGISRDEDGIPARQWERQHTPLVLHWCKVVEALLAAGCPPMPGLVLQRDLELEAGPALAAGGRPMVQLPWWALRPLSFLPLLVGAVQWAPERHAAFLPAFRRAAQQVVLINERRGFGAGLTAGNQQGGVAQRGGRGVQLSRDLLLHILGLASRPFPAWVPQLRFFHSLGAEA